jgi:putative flippase GtrA
LHTLVFRYTFFAILATLANLAAQRAVLWFGDSGTLFALAVGTGTGVGLVLKYFLDKRWIFEDLSSDVKEHGKKFSLYTAMGIFTTAIFWGTETGFWLVWQTDMMRELGAVIGLSIGYVVKYCLDRRFVFTGTRLGQST